MKKQKRKDLKLRHRRKGERYVTTWDVIRMKLQIPHFSHCDPIMQCAHKNIGPLNERSRLDHL